MGIYGQPDWTSYETLEEAEEAALELAEEMAKDRGIDVDSVSLYDNFGGERGACPAGDDGTYWPHIELAE